VYDDDSMSPWGIRGLAAGVVGALGGWQAAGCDLVVGIPDVSLAPADAGDASLAPADSGDASIGLATGEAGACTLPDGGPRAGPAMVRLASPEGSYCIDATEVTVAQYNAYLLDSGTLVDAPAGCTAALAEGMLAAPLLVDNQAADQDLPVSPVGECYAWSYCRWASKRLCGKLGDGGTVTAADPAVSTEWGYACTNGKQNTAFPYGQTYDASVCNTESDGALPVGSKSGCHGLAPPFDRIFDLSGNAWEYVNDLSAATSTADPWGGSWTSQGSAGCTPSGGFNGYVFNPGGSGFRCCADAP
jgi:sulfatase modifying factor 1